MSCWAGMEFSRSLSEKRKPGRGDFGHRQGMELERAPMVSPPETFMRASAPSLRSKGCLLRLPSQASQMMSFI